MIKIISMCLLLLSSLSFAAQTMKKYALITGVSHGIGHSLALNLLKRNIHVIGIARTPFDALPKDLISNQNFSYIAADLTIEHDILSIKKYCINLQKRLDFIIHNAGIMMPPCTLDSMSFEDIDSAIKLNLIAPIKLSALLVNLCNPEAKILNVTSRAADYSIAQLAPYCISKAGLNRWTGILKQELEQKKIAVACVIPGEVDTNMQNILRNTRSFYLSKRFQDNFIKAKLISPAVCAEYLSWLLCEMSHNEFNSKQVPWDIYDKYYHARWLNNKTIPESPF